MTSPSPDLSQEYLDADKGPGIRAGNAIVGIVAVLAVVLRVVSRRIKGLRLGVDDWLIVASLVSAATDQVCGRAILYVWIKR